LEKNNQALLFNDNKAMINFVHGESTAKGVRHMERRMWYSREKYLQGKIKLEYLVGKVTLADRLTKLDTAEEHIRYTTDILGLNLLRTNHYPLSEISEISSKFVTLIA
jgi:hypothetical protein